MQVETNFEHYKEQLLKDLLLLIVDCNTKRKYLKTPLESCSTRSCDDCNRAMEEWLNTPYTEPKTDWKSIPVDTLIETQWRTNQWRRRYFAYYKDDKVYAYDNGATSKTAEYKPSAWDLCDVRLVEE